MKKRGTWFALVGGFSAVAAVWFASAFVLRWFIPALDSRGVFGDSYGALNALFSGLAFAGVVFAILQQNESRDQQNRALDLQLKALKIQQDDLKLQIDEMKATREEMKRQASASERLVAAMQDQRHATLFSAAVAATTAVHEAAYRDTRYGPVSDAKITQFRVMLEVWLDAVKLQLEGMPIKPGDEYAKAR